MARVIALVPDLLFGSQVQGSLQAAGHDVALAGDEAKVRERLGEGGAVLVVDLTDAGFDGAGIRESLAADGLLDATRSLAFFSHVDTAAGERGREAGFDLVVPRSRMAREGAVLVDKLVGGG